MLRGLGLHATCFVLNTRCASMSLIDPKTGKILPDAATTPRFVDADQVAVTTRARKLCNRPASCIP
jgi:hypothetical protein